MHDIVSNAVYDGMKRGIRVAIENKCYGSAVILIYSAIDTLAALDRPANQNDVQRQDFIRWVDRFIHLPPLKGVDFYGARCAVLHTYGMESRLSRDGQCKMIGYSDNHHFPVNYNPAIEPNMAMLSIAHFADALYLAIDEFLPKLFETPEKAALSEERFDNVFGVFACDATPIEDAMQTGKIGPKVPGELFKGP